jgi:hypothetical protein
VTQDHPATAEYQGAGDRIGAAALDMSQPLPERLEAMVAEDRRVRAELAATGELYDGYAPRMAAVHQRNALALRAILDEHGWPGRTLVGEQGAQAAWTILQHAIGDPYLQRSGLPLLQAAVAAGEAPPAQAAYLEDRICFFERRPQRYGTQFDWDEQGLMSPWTLADPLRVDEDRQAVGLESLADRLIQVRRDTAGSAPPDFARRQAEMLDWARSVGWLR